MNATAVAQTFRFLQLDAMVGLNLPTGLLMRICFLFTLSR